MRPTAFILSLLVLILNCIPCRDHAAFNRGTSNGQVVVAASHEGSQADDGCSPFCTCSCCASISMLYSSPQVGMFLPRSSEKKFPAYNAPFYSVERSSIWQPPKIG